MGISTDTVREIFSYLEAGSGERFFEHVSENVNCTVEGTHPLAGRYTSKQDFRIHTFDRLNKILPGGAQLHVQQILIDSDWAAVEFCSHATAITGMRFDNRYCWVIRFEDNIIVEVRAYLDSALVQKLIDETDA
jgi:uncharacterized protein